MLVGNQAARMVAARAGEVRVDVHPAGHDHHAPRIERRYAGRQALDDTTPLDADVPDLAIDSVGGVVDCAASDPEPLRGGHAVLPVRCARTTPRRAASVSAAERGPPSGGRSGSGTSSMRYAVPPS